MIAIFWDRRWPPFALALILGGGATLAGWMVGASPAEQALLAARWTARAALPLFLVAYIASSLLRLWPGEVTRALVRRRRQWGLSFALAHSIHLGALLYNILIFDSRPLLTLLGGGLAYVLIYVMAATSNVASMRMLGKWWKRLHRFGIHYIWLIFTLSYLGRFSDGDSGHFMTAITLFPLMIAALALRLYARFCR